MRGRWAFAAITLILLSGCSQDVNEGEAARTAVAFLSAEPGQACGLLVEDTAEAIASHAGTACAQALADHRLPEVSSVRGVEVAGESAVVRFDDQVVFLAHFPDGWRVRAAGCVRTDEDPAVPYDCEVEP